MLLLDVGNSAIKGQWWLDDELQYSFSCRVTGDWQTVLKSIVSEIGAKQCYYASVADPELEAQLRHCLDEVYGVESNTQLTTQKIAADVYNGYAQHEKLGVDRWLALLGGADTAAPVDKLIIDAGSAITVDLLTKDGEHLGGAILPGFNTSLTRFKQIMSKVDFDHPDIICTDEPGCSTEACIHINYGSADALTDMTTTDATMVDRLIDRWFKRLAPDAVMIVAGGDANRINSHQQYLRYEIPDLVFRGMRKQLDSQE